MAHSECDYFDIRNSLVNIAD